MKLWHVAQWGNKEEGPDGWDTQCVIRANDMEAAVKQAEFYISDYNRNYRQGQADVVYLLGDDGTISEQAKMVITIWKHPAYNLGGYPSWHRDEDTNEWVDFKTRYPD